MLLKEGFWSNEICLKPENGVYWERTRPISRTFPSELGDALKWRGRVWGEKGELVGGPRQFCFGRAEGCWCYGE